MSFEIAKRYRAKINPTNRFLPDKDIEYLKNKIMAKVKSELMLRILKGYENIDLDLVEPFTNKVLIDVNIKL